MSRKGNKWAIPPDVEAPPVSKYQEQLAFIFDSCAAHNSLNRHCQGCDRILLCRAIWDVFYLKPQSWWKQHIQNED